MTQGVALAPMTHIARLARWIPAVVFGTFASAWLAMIALTHAPSSELLWMINLTTLEIFREPINALQGTAGLSVVSAAALAVALTVASTLSVKRRFAPVRFVMAHLAVITVGFPVMYNAVAATTAEASFGSTGGGFSLSLLDGGAWRLGLAGAALFACAFAHAEVMRRVGRQRAVQDRARRLLSIQ